MASTLHHVPTCGLAKEDLKSTRSRDNFRDPSNWCANRHSNPNPHLKHAVTGQPLWMDSWGNSCWIHGNLSSQKFTAEPCYTTLSFESFIASLRACTRNKDLVRGASIHHDLVQSGLLEKCSDALVTMYAKCGDLREAQTLIDKHKSKDVITWTALIGGYARDGRGQNALDCLQQMQSEGISPNTDTYVCTLKACANIKAAYRGKQIHDEIARQGLLRNSIVLGNALVDMYAKCGNISKAQRVHEELPSRNVASWNALITGHIQEGEAEQALNCFEEMQHEGILPNAVTYACAIKACATIRAADRGKQFHDKIARQGLLQNNIVLGSALVDMYAKCGQVSEARRVLEELPSRDVVAWSTLIAGYAQKGQVEQALNCLEQMQHEGILPNAVTYVCALKACATNRAADRGKQIHKEIARHGLLQKNIVLGGALVDMYAKCGDVSDARRVLEELPFRNIVAWNALIAGYAQEGEVEQALDCSHQMQREGILPNEVTCASVLNVCSHLGLVEEGQELFANMSIKYGLKPSLECYTCMIDLFGRAGHLEKAVRLVQEMPSVDYAIWRALLGACRKWADVNVGEWAFDQAVNLDKSEGSAYVLMANVYGTAGMGEKAKSIEAIRIRNKAWKVSF